MAYTSEHGYIYQVDVYFFKIKKKIIAKAFLDNKVLLVAYIFLFTFCESFSFLALTPECKL